MALYMAETHEHQAWVQFIFVLIYIFIMMKLQVAVKPTVILRVFFHYVTVVQQLQKLSPLS